MIKSFRHKGLQRLFEHDDGSKLPSEMLARLRLILSTLHAAEEIEGMNVPTFRLHPLKGDLKGCYAVTVRGIGGSLFVLKMETLSAWILPITTKEAKLWR